LACDWSTLLSFSALDSRACVTQMANPGVICSGAEGLRDLYCRCLSRSKYSLLYQQIGLYFLVARGGG